jgi:hypothetical protein
MAGEFFQVGVQETSWRRGKHDLRSQARAFSVQLTMPIAIVLRRSAATNHFNRCHIGALATGHGTRARISSGFSRIVLLIRHPANPGLQLPLAGFVASVP